MSPTRRGVEFELESFHIEDAGFTEPPFIARFELIWPRPGIENVKYPIPLPNKIGQTVDWTDASLERKLIFKEDTEGRFVFSASVMPLKEETMTSDVAGDAGDVLSRLVSKQSTINLTTLSDMLDLGSSLANFLLSGTDKTIAEGYVTVENQVSQSLTIPLTTPNTLQNPSPDPTPQDNAPEDDHQEVLKQKGDPNGTMEIKMNVWDE